MTTKIPKLPIHKMQIAAKMYFDFCKKDSGENKNTEIEVKSFINWCEGKHGQ